MARHAAQQHRTKGRAEGVVVRGLAAVLLLGGALAPAAGPGATAAAAPDGVGDSGSEEDAVAVREPALADATTAPPTVDTYPLVLATDGPPAAGSAATDPEPEAPATPVAPGGTVALRAPRHPAQAAGPVVESAGFQTVGVTWPAGGQAQVPELQVRVLGADGRWSAWQHLELDSDAPDEASHGGTAPLYVGQAYALQLATVGAAAPLPAGASLALIGSAEVTDPAAHTAGTLAEADPSPTTLATTTPTVVTRAQWGAAPPTCTWGSARSLVGAAIHHTVNANTYADPAAAMQLIRNAQAYHQKTRGWCDIGYNFLVDKWGNIYEGAAGSLTSALIGAHASGFNTGTVGVALLGDHTLVAPSEQALRSSAHIATYRLALYGVAPTGTMSYTSGGGSSRYPAGTVVSLPRIFGHRDTSSTACPGQLAYDRLGTLRTMAGQWAANEYAQLLREAPLAPDSVHKRNLSVVRSLYQDLFGREADASGLAKWTAFLDDGNRVSALTRRLTSSTEYRTLRISRAYQDLLDRPVDAAGLESRLTAVSTGSIKLDDVPVALLGSWEYYRRAGGTEAAFVSAAYRDALGRSASSGEVMLWVGRFPDLGRADVARRIWGSDEARRVRVDGYYRLFFGRPADASGAQKWTDLMRYEGEDFVRAALTGSREYLERALVRFPV